MEGIGYNYALFLTLKDIKDSLTFGNYKRFSDSVANLSSLLNALFDEEFIADLKELEKRIAERKANILKRTLSFPLIGKPKINFLERKKKLDELDLLFTKEKYNALVRLMHRRNMDMKFGVTGIAKEEEVINLDGEVVL